MVTVRSYDFRRPERLTRRNRLALVALAERVADLAGAALSERLRLRCVIRLGETVTTTNTSLESRIGGAAATYHGQLGAVSVAVLFSPGVAAAMVDRLLGGTASVLVRRDQITALDRLFLDSAADDLLGAISQATGRELTAHSRAQSIGAVELIALVGTITLGNQTGSVAFGLGGDGLPTLLQQLIERDSRPARPVRSDGPLAGTLADAPVSVRVALGTIRLAMRDLLDLQPGDVVTLDTPASGSAMVLIDDQESFRATPGVYRGRQAVRISTEYLGASGPVRTPR